MPLRQDIREALDAIQGKFAPDAPWGEQIRIAVREVMDVVGDLLDAPENRRDLADELGDAAGELIDKLNVRPIVKRFALPMIEDQIPLLIDQFALYAGTAQEFADAHVVPVLDEVINALVDARDEISSQPKPPQE